MSAVATANGAAQATTGGGKRQRSDEIELSQRIHKIPRSQVDAQEYIHEAFLTANCGWAYRGMWMDIHMQYIVEGTLETQEDGETIVVDAATEEDKKDDESNGIIIDDVLDLKGVSINLGMMAMRAFTFGKSCDVVCSGTWEADGPEWHSRVQQPIVDALTRMRQSTQKTAKINLQCWGNPGQWGKPDYKMYVANREDEDILPIANVKITLYMY